MQGFASFIMRGRLQAIAVVAAASLLPLLSWFGGGVVALVALRRGWADALTVMGGATAVLAVVYGVQLGVPQLALWQCAELWLPVLVLACWLRYTISLASTLRLAAVLAALAVLTLHLAYPDPADYWRPMLEQTAEVMAAGSEETRKALRELQEGVLPYLTGLWALSLQVAALVSLLLGRWLQAMLYNPGGFRREFLELDLGRPAALVLAVILLWAALQGAGLGYDLALAVGAVFALQALSLVHAAVARRGLSRGWLVGLYVLLPFAFGLYVVIGMADAAFGWRRRLLGPDGTV